MSRRFVGLDGLRGIAALIVVFCHTGLIFQAWAGGPDPLAKGQPESWAGAIQQSPLGVLFAGGAAVFVFFILSGFVLILPFLRAPRSSWVGYYPKRLLRLYVPIVGAVVLAALVISVVPRFTSLQQTWWVNAHDKEISLNGLIREAFVLLGTGRYNSVLWSLSWEILFSLVLPVYVMAVIWLRRWWLGGTASLIVLSTVGLSLDNAYLEYLPMFGIGAFLAVGKNEIIELASRRPVGAASMFGAVILLSAIWSLPWLPAPRLLLLTACTGLVVAFMVWGPAIRFSGNRIVGWLGSRSFSLYLVHEPIVVSSALIFPGAPWLATMVALPLAMLGTELFFRLIEDPSRLLANWVGLRTNDYIGRCREKFLPQLTAGLPWLIQTSADSAAPEANDLKQPLL